MTHSVKLIDKNWHWEDKAMDVRDKSMYRVDTIFMVACTCTCHGFKSFAVL